MPQKVIKFKGINRDINEYYTSGECEELINLRPKANGGLSVVKPKKEIYNLIAYEQFYEHEFSNNSNQIAVLNGEVLWLNSPNGKVSVTKEFVGKKIDISFAGNVMIVYSNEEKKQDVFKFQNGSYKWYDIKLRPITNIDVSYDVLIDVNTENPDANGEMFSITTEQANSLLSLAVSSFYNSYPNGLCGAVVFGVTYELDDGSEVWSTAFVSADCSYMIGYTVPHMSSYDEYLVIRGAKKIKLSMSFGEGQSVGVKRINIYSSVPVTPYKFQASSFNVYSSKHSFEKEGRIMYYQGSVDPNENEVEFTPSFGISLAGEKTMEVLPGCIERVGQIMSYNNRFHYYDSEVYHTLQIPTVSVWRNNKQEFDYECWVSYVNYERKWYLIDHLYEILTEAKNDFIYPMIGVKEIRFVKAIKNTDGGYVVIYNEDYFSVKLKDSSAYNYSYAFDVEPEVVPMDDDFYNELYRLGQVHSDEFKFEKSVRKSETNTINVSAQFNPFSFPVEYSYSFSGNVQDIATSYLPVSSVQIGQYPLTVFTSNGIFAMEQGNGSVLYSNIVPLQPLVSRGKSVSTPHGIFFFSSDNVYLLYGREIACVSGIMQGKAESNIRELAAYQKLCFSKEAQTYDFSSLISSIEFKDFIANASLTYDPLQDEVIISNQDEDVIPYSYVLNLSGKTYHKIMLRYTQFQNGGRYVLTDSGTQRSVVDLHSENDYAQYILLQSRPMSLDVLYTHMQRLMLLADAKLEGRQYLFVSVFASDNLHDWKCIISAQKRGVAFKHIRTNKAAKSYKDYVILINGIVSTDTDISDLIADYTVVQRRLG